jgi:hypothetical protein
MASAESDPPPGLLLTPRPLSFAISGDSRPPQRTPKEKEKTTRSATSSVPAPFHLPGLSQILKRIASTGAGELKRPGTRKAREVERARQAVAAGAAAVVVDFYLLPAARSWHPGSPIRFCSEAKGRKEDVLAFFFLHTMHVPHPCV